MEEMLYIYANMCIYIYVYRYIEEIQGTESPKSRKTQKYDW